MIDAKTSAGHPIRGIFELPIDESGQLNMLAISAPEAQAKVTTSAIIGMAAGAFAGCLVFMTWLFRRLRRKDSKFTYVPMPENTPVGNFVVKDSRKAGEGDREVLLEAAAPIDVSTAS